MSKDAAAKYGGAFLDVLFIRLRSDNIKSIRTAGKVFVYAASVAFYYAPIILFTVKKCFVYDNLAVYALIMALIHIFARVMLVGSKRIQRRFATVKTKKHFLLKTWLVLEYVIFMWVVYLFYPLVCIMIPLSALVMSFENMLGFRFIFDLFMNNSETFLLVGGMVSYVLFIIADGYRRIREGFLPDYLGLYVLLTVVSSAIGRVSQKFVEFIALDVSMIAGTLSWVLSVSNNAMNIVATVMALAFAVHSLYKNCGTGEGDNEETAPEENADDSSL